MKKWISLALCAGMLAGLCACADGQQAQDETSLALQDDGSYLLLPAADAEPLPDAGATIALAVNSTGAETGVNALLWQGVQDFCENFGFTAQLFTAEGEGTEANQEALRQAAESAELVVCAGADMENPLYELQNNYPTVSYLMLDGEPHSADYASYSTAANVHCVLFSEEQAGYLAGYAAVSDNYTSLGFLGADQLPGIVRYSTGFLQGAQRRGSDGQDLVQRPVRGVGGHRGPHEQLVRRGHPAGFCRRRRHGAERRGRGGGKRRPGGCRGLGSVIAG